MILAAAQGAANQAPTSGQMESGGSPSDRSPRIVMREAVKVLADLDLEVAPVRLRLVVRRFMETSRSDIDFRTWFLAYADPTGETAVKRTMKTRGF